MMFLTCETCNCKNRGARKIKKKNEQSQPLQVQLWQCMLTEVCLRKSKFIINLENFRLGPNRKFR